MNILVTGGMGLIGHNIVTRLQDQGHMVVIVDNATNYGIIPDDEIDYLMRERRKKTGDKSFWYTGDITDKEYIDKIFNVEEPEIVIHLASFPRQKVVNNNPALVAEQ